MPSTKKTGKAVPAVSVKGLSILYGNSVVIDDISFDVSQGSVTAIIGPNGSGKTTLVKAVLDLVPHTFGEIRIFGKPLHSVRCSVGYVPQKFSFDRDFPITVHEFMDLARHKHSPKSRIPEKIEEVGLPKHLLTQHLGSLSGGQLQRVLMAQAILNDPTLLILDEPEAGIDIVGEKVFYDIIKHLNQEHDTTVIIVSHDIAVVSSLVDQVICVNKKLMCLGPPATALSEKTMSEVFGPNANVYEHEHEDGKKGGKSGRHTHNH